MRIFITGYANSGTTLLRRLFYAFEDVDIIDSQISLVDFIKRSNPDGILVGKRMGYDIFAGLCLGNNIQQSLDIITDNDIHIVNIIRDGRDALHTTRDLRLLMERWNRAVEQYFDFPGVIDVNIRYEDLVRNPDKIQAKIINTLNLKKAHSFSAYPDFIPKEFMPETDKGQMALRPIDSSSIGKLGKISMEEYLQLPEVRKTYKNNDVVSEFKQYMKILEYD